MSRPLCCLTVKLQGRGCAEPEAWNHAGPASPASGVRRRVAGGNGPERCGENSSSLLLGFALANRSGATMNSTRIAIGVAVVIVIVAAVILVLRRNQKDLDELRRQQTQEDVKTVLGDEQE